MNIITKMGIIVLAGGKSSRLGQPKQLLDIQGKPLIQHIIDIAYASALGPVILITGAHAERLPMIPNVDIVHNPEWEEGMATSIRSAVHYVQDVYPDIDGLMILVSDQPYLDSAVFKEMAELQKEKGYIAVAASYKDQLGTPVLFHRSLWAELLLLKGDVGAKKILNQIIDKIGIVPFEKGLYDIDTMEDYESFKSNSPC